MSSSGDAESMMMGKSRSIGESRIRSKSSMPSIRGIRTSKNTSAVSGFLCKNASASTPSAAS